MNFSGLLGMRRLKTSICLAWAFCFNTSTPRLSIRRSPLEYTTVESGTTSPALMTVYAVSVQFYPIVSPHPHQTQINSKHTFPTFAPAPTTLPAPTVVPSPTAVFSPTSTVAPVSTVT